MAKHLCEQCNEPSDGIDGLCSSCRAEFELRLMIDGMSEEEYVAFKAGESNAASHALNELRKRIEEPTDAEIDRSQRRYELLFGFNEDDGKVE